MQFIDTSADISEMCTVLGAMEVNSKGYTSNFHTIFQCFITFLLRPHPNGSRFRVVGQGLLFQPCSACTAQTCANSRYSRFSFSISGISASYAEMYGMGPGLDQSALSDLAENRYRENPWLRTFFQKISDFFHRGFWLQTSWKLAILDQFLQSRDTLENFISVTAWSRTVFEVSMEPAYDEPQLCS